MSVPRYAPGSDPRACPAATGDTRDQPHPCGVYPDTAHRCRCDRYPHPKHTCLCGYQWLCLNTEGLTAPEIRAITHPPRHCSDD